MQQRRPSHAETGRPLLIVEHLTMRFGGLVAINDLSFTAKTGDITALIGPNGAGKTTVFNCITGFYKPTVGRMALHKWPRTTPPCSKRSTRIGGRWSQARARGDAGGFSCSSACPTIESPPAPALPARSRTSACSPA